MLSSKYREMAKWIIYQIYPRSFMDANGDGIGDLQGVIRKLDHLKELGVNAIWLCPCYKSPNDDNGYDIADYRDIMDEFGTMDDMKELIAGLHARGMKLIMDLVPNHTSTAHKWFRESRKGKDNPYSDYYYWFDEPQNDWTSCFGGTAWEYDEMRGQYYLHSYAISQADLNWECPAVVKEMQDIVDFWVDLGVDGFRCDVIDQISKDFVKGTNCFGPRLHEFIHALFGREKAAKLFTVGECWADSMEEVVLHSASERDELTTLFQFEHIGMGGDDKFARKPMPLRAARDIILRWESIAEEHDLLYSLFTDNHDQSPFISRLIHGENDRYELATATAALFYTLKGVPFIYQGQEFGTMAPEYDSIDCFDDIESKNFYKEFCETMSPEEAIARINSGSRDNNRRPICWDGSEYNGFSTHEPWIKPHSEGKEHNLEADKKAEKSIFEFYKKLLKLRASEEAITLGKMTVISKESDNYAVMLHEYEGSRLVAVVNFEEESKIEFPVEALSADADGCPKFEQILTNYAVRRSANGTYAPFEAAVYRLL